MADPVNLRRYRKQRARQAAEEQAAANRSRHGRTPAERRRDAAAAERQARELDGKRLSRTDREEEEGPQRG